MGSINFSIAEYYDAITETVAIKSGLLLTNLETVAILKRRFDEKFFDQSNLDAYIRIRAEELDYHIHWIRVSIGNLSETLSGPLLLSEGLMPWHDQGYDIVKELEIFVKVYSQFKGENPDPRTVIKLVQEQIDIPEGMVVDIALLISEHQFRSSYVSPQMMQLDGTTPLSSLFNCELHAKDGFLDQSFLDYLAANSENLEYIHWRNFEKLCAEYFRRQGYEIVLGPGSNDGGVDLRAFSKDDPKQPLLLVQCKRYSKENKVDIPTVKAFYADVDYEKAKHGIIATTSYIATGGKKIAHAREYPLSFAENEDIKKWVASMWRYSK